MSSIWAEFGSISIATRPACRGQLASCRHRPCLGAMAPPSATSAVFIFLTLTSVSMTLSNKWLMMRPGLADSNALVLVAQNSVSCLCLSLCMVSGVTQMRPVTKAQAAFYLWGALVLVAQLYTSFEALRRVPVATATVLRALAVPFVAFSERCVLGKALSWRRHGCGWLILAGTLLYAWEDLFARGAAEDEDGGELRAGYVWAALNLAVYCSNSRRPRVHLAFASARRRHAPRSHRQDLRVERGPKRRRNHARDAGPRRGHVRLRRVPGWAGLRRLRARLRRAPLGAASRPRPHGRHRVARTPESERAAAPATEIPRPSLGAFASPTRRPTSARPRPP